MKKIGYIIFLLLCCSVVSRAQIKVSMSDDRDSVIKPSSGVVMHTDPRLAVLIKKHKTTLPSANTGGSIRSGRGYRVQVYNGPDRNKATKIKLDFMRRFPNIRTYLTYVSPHFRVKVGDFRTRSDAEGMYKEASGMYTPCMIVPDIIVINTLKDD